MKKIMIGPVLKSELTMDSEILCKAMLITHTPRQLIPNLLSSKRKTINIIRITMRVLDMNLVTIISLGFV